MSTIKKSPPSAPVNEIMAYSNRRMLLAVAFIEGGSVMAVELAGAKMIAPFYGTSLYVWASVLAVTLGGLTLGYLSGGWATSRFQAHRLMFWELIAAATLVALMPLAGLKILPNTMEMGVRSGSLLSAMLCLGPALVALGMVSPAVIQLNNDRLENTGKTSGAVYAVSTLGGILMTLLVGFYLLPEWGIRKTLYLTATLLFINTMLVAFLNRKNKGSLTVVFMLVFMAVFAGDRQFAPPRKDLKFVYRSEGLLGQLSVLQNPDPNSGKTYRHLYINHIAQTWVDERFVPFSEWNYPHRLGTLASVLPVGSNALLIGMGGGSVAMECRGLGFELDIVELDERVPALAEKYFGFQPEGSHVYIDDGRHFINTCHKQYNLIIIDVLNGEVQPHHLFTMEALTKLKSMLRKPGLLLINNQGYLAGPYGRASRSLYYTLQKAGFQVQYFQSNNNGDGDVHFMASLDTIDFHNIRDEQLNPCCRYMPHQYSNLVTEAPLDLEDAIILTDDQPVFEVWSRHSNEGWRKTALDAIINREKINKIPFFQ